MITEIASKAIETAAGKIAETGPQAFEKVADVAQSGAGKVEATSPQPFEKVTDAASDVVGKNQETAPQPFEKVMDSASDVVGKNQETALKPSERMEEAAASGAENAKAADGEGKKPESDEGLEKARKEYIDDIKAKSDVPDTVKDDGSKYERISSEENAEKRGEFNKKKLIPEWEKANGQKWPRYEKDLYVKGKDGQDILIRRAGQPYDAHHIHPLGLGGKNEASNITPISADKHRELHAKDSPYGRLEKMS
jgi:hypothetical protein